MVDMIPVNLSKLNDGIAARPVTWWERIRWRLLNVWWPIKRAIPYLVWRGDEVDVTVCFTTLGLGGNDDTRLLYEIEERLLLLGLDFDTGAGRDGRDWEWDYSLTGPISIKFRNRHKVDRKPRIRPTPTHPKPTLRVVEKPNYINAKQTNWLDA